MSIAFEQQSLTCAGANELAIATGGDDQALHVLLVSLDTPGAGQGAPACVVSSRLLQNAHSSALKVGAMNECLREANHP